MCGIVGSLYHSNIPIEEMQARIYNSCNVLKHRGPDDFGVQAEENWALGHVRLSILDLTKNGRQPMQLEGSHLVITYNGEVYNYKELRTELEEKGINFKTRTDTEVILRAFEYWKEKCFVKFNGMFAFSIIDKLENRAWLVRDRFGIKPLYYKASDNSLLFASEIKSILPLSKTLPSLKHDILSEFSYYGNNLGENTLYKDIKKLLPGHFLEINLNDKSVEDKVFWEIENIKPRKITSNTVPELTQLLDDAVRRQLVSDVPVGVFLSGGIDSSAITAFASKHYEGKLNTYSVGFDFDKGVNELPKAKTIARLFNTQHHELEINGYDITDTVIDLIHHHDLPFSDAANIPLYLLGKKINGSGASKVILQGDGGDEFFGGYQRHSTLASRKFPMLRIVARLMSGIQNLSPKSSKFHRLKRFTNAIGSVDDGKLMALLLTVEDEHEHPENIFSKTTLNKYSQRDPFQRFRDLNERFSELDLLQRMLFIDTQIVLPDIFLEKVDRSTMAASIEVRVPFLDNDLTDFILTLPSNEKVKGNNKKYLLKKALHNIIPHEILYGPKTGFGVPFGYWIKGPLKDLLFDTLSDLEIKGSNILNYKYIKQLHDEHSSSTLDHGFLLWKTMNFALWLKKNGL